MAKLAQFKGPGQTREVLLIYVFATLCTANELLRSVKSHPNKEDTNRNPGEGKGSPVRKGWDRRNESVHSGFSDLTFPRACSSSEMTSI